MGTCPLSKIEYKGCCPVKDCFAFAQKLEHGCLKQLSKENLLKYFKSSNLRLRRTATEQVAEMIALLNIKSILEEIPKYNTCNCGKKICTNVNCDNILQLLKEVKEYYSAYKIILDNRQAAYLLECTSYNNLNPIYKLEWREKWKKLTTPT